METRKLTRRALLRATATAAAAIPFIACQPKVVEVEKIITEVVKETIIVAGTPKVVEKEVTKIVKEQVKETVVVEKEVTAVPEEYPLVQMGHKWVVPEPILPTWRYDLDIHHSMIDPGNYLETESNEDNIVLRYIKEATGIQYFPDLAVGGGQYGEVLAVNMAAGTLPEYISWIAGGRLGALVEADMIEDITDIWEATASPLVKRRTEYPTAFMWRLLRRNGRIYNIPWSKGPGESDLALWIRKDLLDKTGLGIPDTVEELAEVARAFMKLGCSMGFAAHANLTSSSHTCEFSSIFGAMGGSIPSLWMERGGELVWGSILPECIEGLRVFRGWYEEGILAKDYPSRHAREMGELTIGGEAGIFFGRAEGGWGLAPEEQVIEGAEWMYVDTPAGPDGRRMRRGLEPFQSTGVFLKGTDPEKIEAFINHLNWAIEVYEASTMGKKYAFEGYDYVIEDGKIVDGPAHTEYHGYEYGANGRVMQQRRVVDARKRDGLRQRDPAGLNPLELYAIEEPRLILYDEGYIRLYDSVQWAYPNHYCNGVPPTPARVKYWADLAKLESEAYTNIVTGRAPLESFDAFVDEWLAIGGEEVTREIIEALD